MAEAGASLRLDKFLWFARIVRKREWAAGMAASGHLRVDGRAVDKAATPVHVGQVLSFAAGDGRVRVLRVERLPDRRGPAADARALYTDLDASQGSFG